MPDLCRFGHLMFDSSSDPDPNEGIDDALRVLARIIARHLSGKDAHTIAEELTRECNFDLLEQHQQGG